MAELHRLTVVVFLSLLVADAFAQPQPVSSDWPPERMTELMRDLADEAFEHFVVRDPNRRVYGMSYEFVQDGQHVQDFGLDSMHDGSWLMSALVTAHRIDSAGDYLERAQRYHVPFYVNVLTNSDRLFPHMLPREGQEQFESPIQGWAPRGWDDGPGIDLIAGAPFSTGVISHPDGTVIERNADGRFQHSYFTSSHHLLQDVADGLLNVWLTTRDPRTAHAILLIHENRMKYGHRIPVVQKAAGLTNGMAELYQRPHPPAFTPAAGLRPLWQGLVERQPAPLGHYDDGLAWTLREEIARAAISGQPLAPGFVATGIGRVYAYTLVVQSYFRETDYRPGLTLSPGALVFEPGTGKLAKHHNEHLMAFARGIQYAWIAAALLPSFREDPSAWKAAIEQMQADGTFDQLRAGAADLGVEFETDPDKVAAHLDAYTMDTIDYWAGVRKQLGYLPRGYFLDGRRGSWVRMAELGAYAHLIKLIAYRLMDQAGMNEVDLIREQTPQQPLRHDPLPDSVRKTQGLD